VIEEASALEVEVAVPEQDIGRVRPGQPVELRARAVAGDGPPPGRAGRPVRTRARPPRPRRGETPGTATVYCRLDGDGPGVRPGLTGYARVSCGPRPVWEALRERVLRGVRTEFWGSAAAAGGQDPGPRDRRVGQRRDLAPRRAAPARDRLYRPRSRSYHRPLAFLCWHNPEIRQTWSDP
jgi:hypothetical protein